MGTKNVIEFSLAKLSKILVDTGDKCNFAFP